MGFHGLLQPHEFMNQLAVVLFIFASTCLVSAAKPMNFTITKHPRCIDRCGNVSIPYPFGTRENCYQSHSFFVTCNHTFSPPKLFMQNTTIEIMDISLDGQLKAMKFIAHDCYSPNGTRVYYNDPRTKLSKYFTVNNTANRFTIVGCDTYGYIVGRRLNRHYATGCTAMCDARDDLIAGSCTGVGCCQSSIPKQVSSLNLSLGSFKNHTYVWDFNNCSYAFYAEESAFTFSPESFTNLRNVKKLPMVVDWAVGNGTCEEARMNSSSYACVSANSTCYKPDNGVGYRCSCSEGYEGNPYIVGGCLDIDECNDPLLNVCEKRCVNRPGGFYCHCPKGYYGDGRKEGRGCIRGESLYFKLAILIALGIIVLLLVACGLYLELKRRRSIKTREKFFSQNGGSLLEEKLMINRAQSHSHENAKIFSEAELKKATNNFHNSRVIGRGGFGTVYKGFLNNQIVAIKKSKEVDPTQVEQFVNEVIVLSQINHRNVVKLLGCCFETQVPLLVYEFISNGTLYEHIHNKAKSGSLSWDIRLKIAAESAGVLSYLHSEASVPIIHRDVKSANILLDHTFTAKVSDFGASRLIPLDQMQITTMVLGTHGYLDPEYLQTQKLTEKSDVYSFGVVLMELLTGMKVLSNDRPEEERCLTKIFLTAMKKKCLFQVVEGDIVSEGNKEQLMKVAMLAESCLNGAGDDRPSMREVAMELDGLRLGGKRPWSQKEENDGQESVILIGEEGCSSRFIIGDHDNDSSVGFYSVKDNLALAEDGGR